MRQIPLEKCKKILIVRPDAIGDMVLTIPCIKALKEKYPKKHITVLASKYNARIIEHLPFIDKIIYDKPVQNTIEFFNYVQFLKQHKFDVAIHFYCEARTAWACYFAGIPYNLGDKAKLKVWPVLRKYGLFYKSFDQPKHVVEYNFLLIKPLRIELTSNTKLYLTPPEKDLVTAKKMLSENGRQEKRPLVGIQVGVGFGNRPVTPEKYAEFINKLQDKIDVDVCISGYSPKEIEACKTIQKLTKKPIITILGASIQELMGLISLFDVCVSVDTGPFHLAAAMGIPQLAIFPSKKVKPLSWAPWRNKHFIIRECTSCLKFCPHEGCQYNICSDAIKVDEMVEKTLLLLDEQGISGPEEQFEYWFRQSITILILYDNKTEKQTKILQNILTEYKIHNHIAPVKSKELYKIITENNIDIIQNLSRKRKLYLFLLGQKVTSFIFNPPLIQQGFPPTENKHILIEFYRKQFENKKI